MPTIIGTAVLALTLQLGVDAEQDRRDPLIDQQYAVVKQVKDQPTSSTPARSTTDFVLLSDLSRKPLTPNSSGSTEKSDFRIVFADKDQKLSQEELKKQSEEMRKAFEEVRKEFSKIQIPGLEKDILIPNFPMDGDFQPGLQEMRLAFKAEDALTKVKGLDKRVTGNFNNATVADVMKWMGKQGVSFVGNAEGLESKKLTMNLNNVPLKEALEAIADALDARWEVRGSTLILKKGIAMMQMGQVMDRVRSIAPLKLEGIKPPRVAEPRRAVPEIKRFELKLDGPDAPAKIKELKEIKFKAIDAKGFAESLTPAQKELIKKQGFLKFSDLTDEQRKKLNIEMSPNDKTGEITIKLDINGEQIIIKN